MSSKIVLGEVGVMYSGTVLHPQNSTLIAMNYETTENIGAYGFETARVPSHFPPANRLVQQPAASAATAAGCAPFLTLSLTSARWADLFSSDTRSDRLERRDTDT